MLILPRPALAAALTVSFILCVNAGPTVMSLAAEKEKATLLPAALHMKRARREGTSECKSSTWCHPWEWAGIFTLDTDKSYEWSAEKDDEFHYPQNSMFMLILPAETSAANPHEAFSANSLEEALAKAETEAMKLWEKVTPVLVSSGNTITIGQFANIQFDNDTYVSKYSVRVNKAGMHVFFTQHLPVEFENAHHYFKVKETGFDVKPELEHKEEEEVVKNDKWGEVVGASIVATMPSALCVALVFPFVNKNHKIAAVWDFSPLYALASGALMACTFFLLFSEGLFLASSGKTESEGVWTWGACAMSGWILCVIIHQLCDYIFPHPHEPETSGEAAATEAAVQATQRLAPQAIDVSLGSEDIVSSANEGKEMETTGGSVDAANARQYSAIFSIAGPIILGDFWHNLIDGMMIGFSLKSCGGAFTWAIVGVTFAHEVPQEISDFLVLIAKAKLSPLRALALNFMCGCSCIVGALISYGSDVSVNFQGLAMTLGGGVYLYIATTELGPEIIKAGTLQQYVLRVLCFALGATAIGLVLLGHEHCAPATSGAADPHAGHAH